MLAPVSQMSRCTLETDVDRLVKCWKRNLQRQTTFPIVSDDVRDENAASTVVGEQMLWTRQPHTITDHCVTSVLPRTVLSKDTV